MAVQAGVNTVRIDNLTCARFFAALLVFLHHSATLFPMPVWLKHFFYNGYMGVTFFFVLSGFVISASSADEMFSPNVATVLRFYLRRVARIVPVWLFLSLPMLVSDASRQPGSDMLWRYLTFSQAWSGDRALAFSFLSLSWTLSCEFFFYLVFPAFAFGVLRVTKTRIGVLFGIAAAALLLPWIGAAWFDADPARAALDGADPGSAHRWLYRSPAWRFCEFAFGVCLNLIWRRYADRWRSMPLRPFWWLMFAISVATVFALMAWTVIGPFTWTAAYIAPFGLLIVSLATLEPRRQVRAAGFALLVLLGEASYSFYLAHQSFVLNMVLVNQRTSFTLIWIMVYCAAISVGLYTLIETPARKFITGLLKERRPTDVSPALRQELKELGNG